MEQSSISHATSAEEIQFLQNTVLEYNTVCDQLKEIEDQLAPLKMLKSGLNEAISIFSIEKGIQNIKLPPNAGIANSNKQFVQKRVEKKIGFSRDIVYACIEDVLQEYPDLIAKLLQAIESRLETKETISLRLETIKRAAKLSKKKQDTIEAHTALDTIFTDKEHEINQLIPDDMRYD